MALANYKAFVAGEVLTAADMNALQSHFTGNALALISPITGTLDMNGNILVLDTDADSTLRETSDDVIALRLQGVDAFIFDGDVAVPVNGLTFRSAATGGAAEIAAQGSDTDVGVRIVPKGAGTVRGVTTGFGDYTFAFDSSTSMADPGTGDFRLNNATLSSVTAIAVSDTDSLGLDRDAVLDALVGSIIKIGKLSNPTTYARYHVYAVTDNGAWHQLDVIYKQSSGSLSNTDPCSVVIDTSIRETLVAARTYYVRTDGSDTNTGLVNSSAGAFLTIQKALNVSLTVDQNGFQITIQVGNGTYNESLTVTTRFTGTVRLLGDTTTPSNVVVNSAGTCINVSTLGAHLNVAGIKLTAGASALRAEKGGGITVDGVVDFGAATAYHVYSTTQGLVSITSNYTISGAAVFHVLSQFVGTFVCVSVTVTITGTPAFSGAFAAAGQLSFVQINDNTYSGSATGPRHDVRQLSEIFINGAGATYLLGNSAGTTDATTFGVIT